MGGLTRLERFLARLSWLYTGLKHFHRPSGMYNCSKCQRDAWMDIAAQYQKDSPQYIRAIKRAEEKSNYG